MIALRNLTIEEIGTLKGYVFEVGSESCSIKFCKEIRDLVENRHLCIGKKFRIVTPKVPQAYVEMVVMHILDVIEMIDITAIIINDYGILFELRKLGVKVEFIFGRLLVRSQEYEHNYMKRLDLNENEDVLQSWLNPSILHYKKIELLKEMNFTGVELSPSDSVKNLLLDIKGFELEVFVHYNLFIGAVGRACVSAKQNNVRTGNCSNLCSTTYNLKLAKMYGNFDTPTQEEVDEFSKNIVIGNVLYFLKKVDNFPFDKCKGVIIDGRTNNIKSVLKELRRQLNVS